MTCKSDQTARWRLIVDDARLVGSRPRAVIRGVFVRGALARVGRAHALWPSVDAPTHLVDLNAPEGAEWLRATFETNSRRVPVSAATWNALRARGLLIGVPSGLALEAAQAGLGRPLRGARLHGYSPSASASKIMCFAFEEGASVPSVVIRGMADPLDDTALRREVEMVAAMRARVEQVPALRDALPLVPLHHGIVRGDYVVVEAPDPFAPGTGRAGRDASLRWLEIFQQATTTSTDPWTAADGERALGALAGAAERAPSQMERAIPAVRRRTEELVDSPVRRCAQHGDYWQGNLAEQGGSLRVYDWEWAEFDGLPFLDRWTYELGPLRDVARSRPQPWVVEALASAAARIEAELGRSGMDGRFALATLVPALTHLLFRQRAERARPGGWEPSAPALLDAATALVAG